MCGIAGFTHPGGGRSFQFRDILASIHHRGPDQAGVYQSDIVSLGAVRLRIIDLDHGAQPMRADHGDLVIVFNGEIYNHVELRRELAALGHRFDSHCDTEVVLRAFQQWDIGAFSRLRGMFAAALWRESTRRLVLVRDRLGIKPLYYTIRGNNLYFGSELKTILLHPEIPRELDRDALSYYLALNWVPTPLTLIEGIRKVPAGHWLSWHDGVLNSGTYWDLHFLPDPSIGFEDAKSELDRLMHSSVKEHLISDVPLGVWASGGVDSTAILHYAAQHSGQRLKTFSASFRGRDCDETPWFREVAERYDTEHYEIDINPEAGLTSTIEQMAYYSDEPSADAGALPVWFLSKMTREHVTVALSGDGADELFGGYQTYLADRYAAIARRTPFALRHWGNAATRLIPCSDRKIGLDYKLSRFAQGCLMSADEAHLHWNGTFCRNGRSRLAPALPVRETAELYSQLPMQSRLVGPLNRHLWLDQKFYLPDDILYKVDRMSMAHSLEVRPPFLDHRIAEFAAGLPEHFKIRSSTTKFLLRELLKGKVPASVLNRPKQGFDIPAHAWLRGDLRHLLRDTLNERDVRSTGIFSWPEVDTLIASHGNRRANVGYHLWGLLTLFLWMKRWNVGTVSSEESRPWEMPVVGVLKSSSSLRPQ